MVDIADVHDARTGALPALRTIRLLVAEYRRAMAAEDYYGGLKRMSATALAQDGIARCDIPRRVFDEFYSFHDAPVAWIAGTEKPRKSVMQFTQRSPRS